MFAVKKNNLDFVPAKDKPKIARAMRTAFFAWLFFYVLLCGCEIRTPPEYTAVATLVGHTETRVLHHPEWAKNATLYQVNIWQHTAAGTFTAFEKDLDRLQEMGVTMLWLLPVYATGQPLDRSDMNHFFTPKHYGQINETLGNMDDFRRLVHSAHTREIKVIIGWKADQTTSDHPWVSAHPDWYVHEPADTLPPNTNNANHPMQLDYSQAEMRQAMRDAMKFWVRECDIDGFRCEAAARVPTDFWDDTRAALDSIKPVFMLSDAEMKSHHLKAFDMSPADGFYTLMYGLAQGKQPLGTIEKYMAVQDTAFLRSAYRMYYTSIFPQNSLWGTRQEIFGKARQLYDVLAFTIAGMPVLSTGQEGDEVRTDNQPHRLRILDKDTASWNHFPLQHFYTRLLNAHHRYPALWNGENGGTFKRINTSSDEVIFAFSRKKNDNEVIVLLNFSDKPQKIDFTEDLPVGDFRSIFSNQTLPIFTKGDVKLPAYGYQVFVK